MCLVLCALNYIEDYPIVLLMNREEYYNKESEVAKWNNSIFGGIDKKSSGRWFGIDKDCNFSLVTNKKYTEKGNRGNLVYDLLSGNIKSYENLTALYYKDNKLNVVDTNINELAPGIQIHTINRGDLNSDSLRVNRIRDLFIKSDLSNNSLLNILKDNVKNCHEFDLWDYLSSSIFISSRTYGTRSSLILKINKYGEATFTEIYYDSEGNVINQIDETISKPIKKYKKYGINRIKSPLETIKDINKKLYSLIDKINVDINGIRVLSPVTAVYGNSKFRNITKTDYVSGKGMTIEQSQCSGLMEFAERYSLATYLESAPYLISTLKNNISVIEIYSCLINESIDKDPNPILKLYPGTSLSDNSNVMLPLKLIKRVFHGSNGIAAGNCIEEAILHGLCEVIERHSETQVNELKYFPKIIDNITSNYIMELQFKIKYFNEEIKVYDCSSIIPVVAAIRKVEDKYILACGCATTYEEAIIRAITEVIQVSDFNLSAYEYSELKPYLECTKTVDYNKLENIDDENISVEVNRIVNILMNNKMRPFYCDVTDKELQIPSVYVFVTNAKRKTHKGLVSLYNERMNEYLNSIKKSGNYLW